MPSYFLQVAHIRSNTGGTLPPFSLSGLGVADQYHHLKAEKGSMNEYYPLIAILHSAQPFLALLDPASLVIGASGKHTSAASMADDNDKALYDDLRIAQLAMEDLTTAAPCTRRDVCSSVDAQQEIESALPTVDLGAPIQPGGVGPTGDAGERGRKTGADVTCSPRLGNTKARRLMDGKKFHLKG
ncbi:hypothetical protein M378DRAFT_15548 [Amanita muscaria Koide BX008]|uniref:Uncharacterized protein n=1 Tax=Amanita muscaria (strain Koide BX008) TaxID=946122 RepID=A0A0C2WQA5_AMAMK|nr:hypothetical protein M378DRAFT_15548 [Amanita muscaria Koide BX008]